MNKQTLRSVIFIGLFAIPFIPLLVSSSFFFPFITTKAFAFRIIVEIIFAAWIPLALLDPEVRPKKSLVLYTVFGFLGAVGLSTILGVDVVKSFWSNFERMEGFISLLHLGAFFLVIGSVFNEINWKRWWNTTLFVSALMVVYVLLQLAGVATINQGGVRVDGTFGNAIYLAVYMLFHIFIASLELFRNRKNSIAKWIYGLLILGQIFVLYHTATRGAILGLVGGIVVITILNIWNKENKFAKKTSIIILTSLVVLSGIFVAVKDAPFIKKSPVLSRFSTLTVRELKTQGRYFVWPMAIEGFKEHPILGWGQENFIYVFQEHYRPEMFNLEPWFDRAHNIFLDSMVVGGILGLASYLFLYVAILYLIWKNNPPERAEPRSVRAGLSYVEKSILTGLLAAYFFHNIFVFDNLISYILFFSLLSYIHQRNGSVWSSRILPEYWVKRVVMPLVAIVFLIPLYFWNAKPLMSNVYLIEALKSIQLKEFDLVGSYFMKAYGASTLGRSEVVQHMAGNSALILSSNLSLEKKEEFYAFAKKTVLQEAENYPDDAKIQLLAGSFFSTVGVFDESLKSLDRARILMPNKQDIYFEIANVYINAGEDQKAIDTLNYVSDISPAHKKQMDEYIRKIRTGEL